MNTCLTETTVVPAIRSKYRWRGSGPGVAIPIRKSMMKIIQKILLMFLVHILFDGALLPSSICTLRPMTLFPNVAADADDSITAE